MPVKFNRLKRYIQWLRATISFCRGCCECCQDTEEITRIEAEIAELSALLDSGDKDKIKKKIKSLHLK